MKPKVEIWFELETRCNLQCKFCFNYWKDGISVPPVRIPTKTLLQGLTSLFEKVECNRLVVSGGEPLLREDLFDILGHIHQFRIPMVLASNSLLLDDPTIARLRKTGIVTFQLPLHAARPELHDWLSGQSCWRETIRAIIALREAGAVVVPVFVATSTNLDELTPVIEICSLLGLDDLIFNRFVPGGLGLRHLDLLGVPQEDELVASLTKAGRRARELKVRIQLGVPVRFPEELTGSLDFLRLGGCPVRNGQYKWTLDCEGRIRPCNNSGDSVGTIFDAGLDVLLSDLKSCGSSHSSGRACEYIEQPSQLVHLRPDLVVFPTPIKPGRSLPLNG